MITEDHEPLAARLDRYRPLISEEMRAVVSTGGGELFGWIRYHLGWEERDGKPAQAAPGKLLRPAALLLAAELCGAPPERVLAGAAAVELVHNFSLLHDDIEDASEQRRWRATVWSFAGVAQAINAGDALYTLARLAMYRLPEAGVEERRVIEAMRELDEACLRLVEGQYLDMAFEQRGVVSADEYVAMAAGKTAAMFAAPFAMGALLAGADGEVVAAFREFGYHVGLAFQAVDDWSDIWASEAKLGKSPGSDLRARKMTIPVITALEAGGDASAALARMYGQPPVTGEDVDELRALVEAAGGRAATEALAARERGAALEALQGAALDDSARAVCAEYVALALGTEVPAR